MDELMSRYSITLFPTCPTPHDLSTLGNHPEFLGHLQRSPHLYLNNQLSSPLNHDRDLRPPPTVNTTSHHRPSHDNNNVGGLHEPGGSRARYPQREGCSQRGGVQITTMRVPHRLPLLLVRGCMVLTCRLDLLPHSASSFCPILPSSSLPYYEAACEVHAASFVPALSDTLGVAGEVNMYLVCTRRHCRHHSIFVYFVLLFYYIDDL